MRAGGGHFGGGFGFAHPGFIRPAAPDYYQPFLQLCPPRYGLDGYMSSGGWCVYPDNMIPEIPEAPMPTVPTPQSKPAVSVPIQSTPATPIQHPVASQPVQSTPAPIQHPTPPADVPISTTDVASPPHAPPSTTGAQQPITPPTPHVQASPWYHSPGMLALLGGIALTVLLRRGLIESIAVTQANIRDTASRIITGIKTRREEARRQAEWNRLARQHPHQFQAAQAKREAQVDWYAKRASQLHDIADHWEASPFRLSWVVAHLRNRADEYVAAGHAEGDEIERLDQLYAEISAARETQQRNEAKAKACHLVGLIYSAIDAGAKAALAKLNLLRKHLDLSDLVPSELPSAARDQAAKLLALIAGTNSLGEARSAVARFKQMLEEHGVPWERFAT